MFLNTPNKVLYPCINLLRLLKVGIGSGVYSVVVSVTVFEEKSKLANMIDKMIPQIINSKAVIIASNMHNLFFLPLL